MNKFIQRGLVAAGVLATFGAQAAPVDLSSLTTAVDFSTTSAAILLVAAALIVVYIAIKASSFVLGMVRRG